MRIENFTAAADVVGLRVTVGWDVVLEGAETPADVPAITVRRKERDFAFPADDAAFVVYASTAFPPDGGTVTEIDLGGRLLPDGGRALTTAESVARGVAGRDVEVLRRTRTTETGPDGRVSGRHETVLDPGPDGAGLTARTTYYYELVIGADASTAGRPRAIATPTAAFGSGRLLYEQLPAVYRRHDVVSARGSRAAGAVPEAAPDNGQLRRFLDVFGAGVDHLRGRADGLRDLRDVDNVDARLLPHLAAWLGWNLSRDLPIPQQRHEVRYAAHLYRITGTLPGCTVWGKRLTGWDVEVREMWRNVFVTNDLGNPDDPADHGSRTLDTSDAAALAARGTVDDAIDYTYDASPDGRHAFPVVADRKSVV